MIDDFLFEINCAEELGDFVLADNLDNKLVRIASTNYQTVKRKIERKVAHEPAINDITFSQSLQKFVVSAKPSLDSSVKRKIKNLAEPFGVRFKTSSTSNTLKVSSVDMLEEGLEELKQLGPEEPRKGEEPVLNMLLELARLHKLKNSNC